MNPIVGADVAEIIVGDTTSRGVALCQCATRCPGWQRATLSEQPPKPVWHMRSRIMTARHPARRSALSSRVAVCGDGEMFMLVLTVNEGDASRLFTVAAIERIWPSRRRCYRSDCR